MKSRRADGVVVERPERRVGEPQIEVLVLLVRDVDGFEGEDSLVGSGRLVVVRGTGPTDPQPVSVLQYRVVRAETNPRDWACRSLEPLVPTWRTGSRRLATTTRSALGEPRVAERSFVDVESTSVLRACSTMVPLPDQNPNAPDTRCESPQRGEANTPAPQVMVVPRSSFPAAFHQLGDPA